MECREKEFTNVVWYIPLEYLENRYTGMMDRKVKKVFRERNVNYIEIEGKMLTDKIETGAFLDSEGTNYFKFSQLMEICKRFKSGDITDGDKFFVSDLWFPGIEAIKYMATFRKIDVKIYGIMHAGSWTDTDFVRPMETWAKDIEIGWFKMFEKVFVGSRFHKWDIVGKARAVQDKIEVTGLVFDSEYILSLIDQPVVKEDIVVFPHRLDDEKQPWYFDELAKYFGKSVKFIKTMELGLSKKEYFNLLARSKVAFSCALQENFGYGMLEAALLGVTPVVPNRLSYVDLYPVEVRYNDFSEAVKLVKRYLDRPVDISNVPKVFDGSVDRMVDIVFGE